MDPSSPTLKDSVRAPSSTSTSSSPEADKPIRLTAPTSDYNSSNTTTAPNETSTVAGHTSHVPTPPSSTGTIRNTTRKEEKEVEEDNAPLVDSVSASGSTHTTHNNPGLAPQLPPPGAASSSSSSASSSGSSSSNQLTQQEQQQVEQYKDDIMLHTQLQLQLYLEDMEEAETAAEIQAHIEQAAFAESLINSANALDPLQDSLLHGGYHGFAEGSPGPLSPDATQMFEQQMISLESNALAAAAAADATTPFQLGGGSIAAGGGGLGGGGNAIGGGQGEHAHDGLDLDLAEMDEDDEDCLPPSETKYILYDDHVSPVSMAQALALLNDPLHEELVVHVHSNSSNHYTHDGLDDSRQPISILGRNGDESGTLPIFSAPSPLPPASSLASFSDTRRINPVGATPWSINHTRYAYEEEVDHNFHPWEQEQHGEISRTGHSHTMGLPSPPTAAATSKSSQAGFFGNDNQHLQDNQQRFYGDTNDCATLANDNGCDEEGNCEEENQQGRPSHRRGPDIYLNLAGTIISPINIHDIFFSHFYSRLVYLNLWDTNLGIWGAQAVGGLMADRVCRIQYLNLGCNRLGFEGILQLAGLYKNQSLIELDLSENQLGPKAIHSLQQTMVRLQKDKACNIRRLNLSNNNINDVGCISIAKIILGTSIVQLDLSFNKISDWGASTILAAFESNELTLKEINMEANPLTFAGGVDLCKILVLPQSRITHLDLRGAKVTDVGVPYLAEALKSHYCPVVSLNLYDCQLTDTGILKLAIKLSVNRSLRVLGLGRNCVGDTGIMALSQGLCLNNYLEELDLSENEVEFSRAGLEAMMAAMRKNTSLLHLTLTVEQDHHHMAGNAGTGLYMDLPFHQQQQQYYQNAATVAVETQYYPQEELPSINEPVALTQVGEVLAPTYAALALPLQVPANAPTEAPTPTAATTTFTPPPPLPLPVLPPAPITAAAQEESLARERHQTARAQMSLRAYVRHNYKRTGNMRKLCFEILAIARVLMFAKEDPSRRVPATIATQKEAEAGLTIAVVRPTKMELILGSGSGNSNHNTIISSPDLTSDTTSTTPSLISLQTGLPTPPLATDFKSPTIQGPDPSQHLEQQQQEQQQQRQPRGSLAALPWELKEMILRGLDPEGLLSERQFQAVMNYSATRWETVRQPWERWGEIREMILEKTSCYYYEV
ncbi:NACHT, LRR and PYD domains-containing protein 3 [Linnemannia elongata]|nr:NACHT, LRR and PYD domains-containing protein 3 [Linnemannia elongata]